MKKVVIYTDGSCIVGRKFGGWAAILIHPKGQKIISGRATETTVNRMESQAVIEALKCLKEPCQVYLHIDSEIVGKGITREFGRKANKDLWGQIEELEKIHDIHVIKVKAHSGVRYNNIVDREAYRQAASLKENI